MTLLIGDHPLKVTKTLKELKRSVSQMAEAVHRTIPAQTIHIGGPYVRVVRRKKKIIEKKKSI